MLNHLTSEQSRVFGCHTKMSSNVEISTKIFIILEAFPSTESRSCMVCSMYAPNVTLLVELRIEPNLQPCACMHNKSSVLFLLVHFCFITATCTTEVWILGVGRGCLTPHPHPRFLQQVRPKTNICLFQVNSNLK
jgi:hypothetical protein